jgi:hypothetical protein
LAIFFGKVFFIAFFIRNVSFTVVVSSIDRTVGDVKISSSISGSESTDVDNP